MKIAVLTDSASNLDLEFVKSNPNLFQLPLIINVDGVSMRDQVEISAEEVYEKLDTHTITTSLPLMTDLEDMIQMIKKAGYTDLLVINISSGLSGTFNAIRLALHEHTDLNIVQYDTKTLAGGEGFIVEYALELIKGNTPLDKIVPLLDTMRHQDSIAMYTVSTLKYLRHGGRIGKVEGTIADIINIKPVITVNDEGVYVTLAKSFGLKRALIAMKNILIEKFGKELIDLKVHFGNDLQKAKDLAASLARDLNIRKLSLVALTPVLGIHTGPEMFAYIARRVK